MKKIHVSKRAALYLAIPPLALGVAGLSVAGAAWLNSGTGTATISSSAPVLDSLAGAGSGLYPGVTALPVSVTLTNHNSWSEKIVSPGLLTGTVTDTTHAAGSTDVTLTCPASIGTVLAPGANTINCTAAMVSNPLGSSGDSYSVAVTVSTSTP